MTLRNNHGASTLTRYDVFRTPFKTSEGRMQNLPKKARNRVSRVQPCPQCGGALMIRLLSPAMSAPGTTFARYACDVCGAVRIQSIDSQVSSARSTGDQFDASPA
jgi:hypothetical protein